MQQLANQGLILSEQMWETSFSSAIWDVSVYKGKITRKLLKIRIRNYEWDNALVLIF